MSYNNLIWSTGDLVTAEKLNHIEDGIKKADEKLENIEEGALVNKIEGIQFNSEDLTPDAETKKVNILAAPYNLAVPLGTSEDVNKILEKQTNGFGWIDKPQDGDSAYQIAVKNGFVGTEALWLEYIRGKSAREIYNSVNGTNLTDEQFLATLKAEFGGFLNATTSSSSPYEPTEEHPLEDKIYLTDTNNTPDSTKTMWIYDNNTWVNMGIVTVKTTFKTSENIDDVSIDNVLKNPTNSDVASAKAVMDLKSKLEGIDLTEAKQDYILESGYISYDGSVQPSSVSAKYTVIAVGNAKKVRFLGQTIASHSSNNYSYAFWNAATYTDSSTVVSSSYYDVRTGDTNELKEYIVNVPTGGTYIAISVSPTTENDFYCYLQSGNTVKDLIPAVVDNFDTNDGTKALSAAKGKELHDILSKTTKIDFTKLTGQDASGNVNDIFTPSPQEGRSLFMYNVEEGKDYFLYGGYSKSAGAGWYIYYWTDDDDVIIKREWYGSNFPTSYESTSYNYWAGVKRTAPTGATRLYQRGYTAISESRTYIELRDYKETLTKEDIANDFNGGIGKALSAEKGKEIFDNLSVEKKLTQVGNAFKCSANTLLSMPQGTNIEDNCGSSDTWRMWKYEVSEGEGITMTGYVGSSYGYYHIYWADSSGNLILKDGKTSSSNKNKQFTKSSIAPEGCSYVYILVKYASRSKYDVYYTTEQKEMLSVEDIIDIVKQETIASKTLNVLVIGNSFTQNAMLYVPFLWKNIVEEFKLNLSFFMTSSCPLYHYVDTYEQQAISYKDNYFRYYRNEDGGTWNMETGVSVKSKILNEEFDVVIFQLTMGDSNIGSANHIFDTASEHYRYYVNRFIELIATDTKKSTKFMLLKAHSSANGHPSWSDEERLAELTNTWNNYLSTAEYVEKSTATEGLIRTDTAVMNAYLIPQMLDIGQIGFLSYDNHLQRGLPLQLEGYTVLLHLINMIDKSLSVIGDNTISDSVWESGKLGTTDAASQHGDPTGWSDNDKINAYRLLIIQESALMAYKYPNEITDMTKICVTDNE